MLTPWSVPIFLGVAVILLAVYLAGPRLVTGTATVRRAFWCPFRKTKVSADFTEATWDGKLTDVQACSAFTPATDVGCDKACLALKTLPEAPSRS